MNHFLTLHFLKTGLQTLVVDHGRTGHQAYGVPVGGAMDQSSSRIANWLVGNPPGFPTLEITLVGPEIEFEGEGSMALAGGDLSATLNGEPVPLYQTLWTKHGDKLRFGKPRTGCRTYLSIGGNWEIPQWLGSYSAFSPVTRQSIPQNGDRIKIRSQARPIKKVFPAALRPSFTDQRVGVIEGPEYSAIHQKSLESFFQKEHRIGADSNRMGYRLETTLPHYKQEKEVISSGVTPGTIQITNQGQPIILMADAQTTGGYPRMGHIISDHLDKVAQLKPGDKIRFSHYTLAQAQQAWRDREETLKLILRGS